MEKKILKHACFLNDVNSVEDNTILFSNHLREQYIAIIDINAITVINSRDFFLIKIVGHLVCCNLHFVTRIGSHRLHLSQNPEQKQKEDDVNVKSSVCNVEPRD